jgi:serine/threonine protein phosphatase PrpC
MIKKNIILDLSAGSHIGKERGNNEDNLYLDGIIIEGDNKYFEKSFLSAKSNLILAIFDGVGGAKAGEVASFTAAELLREYLSKNNDTAEDINKVVKHIESYIESSNNYIYLLSEENPEYKNMATTFACLIISKNKSVSINLGDSRIYLFRNKSLKQLSVDHTEAERLVRLGIISREDLQNHPKKNLISRYIGMPPDYGKIDADISNIIGVKRKDIFLLCTDGLTEMVNDNEIEAILLNCLYGKSSSELIAKRLLKEALDRGGRDNVTIIVVRIP